MAYKNYSEKLKDPLWLMKRRQILERDNYTCQSCEDKEGVMHIHHEHYIDGRDPWEYPNEKLITLCETCHSVEEQGRKHAYALLNKAIADAGFTREDVIKLTEAFKSIDVKPVYSYLLMSKIYRDVETAWLTFTPPILESQFNSESF